MRRRPQTALGVVLLCLGGVWFLQGVRVLPGSFMTGSMFWAVTGVVAGAAGLGLLVAGRRGG